MRTTTLVALALSTALAAPAHAQYPTYPAVQAVSPADQLASVIRRLAVVPTDLQALISAGELSVKLDDMSAAAAFFARADKIDPRNGRVKAGMASILVRAERPGEALRYYQMAESFGLPAIRYAADRGLAYDLVGEQERAQRDYRLALRTTPDDEITRRYALSLGISGKQAMALEQLEPMIRRQDRAAWRVRAFVLALNGDVAGANKIAAAVMPAGMASGLRPFFDRLPALPAADRAFAVHFGETRPTPARLADARMKPVLPALGPDPYAPVQVAAAQTAPPPAAQRARVGTQRRTEPRNDRRERGQLASSRIRSPVRAGRAPTSAPARTAATTRSPSSSITQPAPRPAAPGDGPPAQVAAAQPRPIPAAPVQTARIGPVPVRTAPATGGPLTAPVQGASAAPLTRTPPVGAVAAPAPTSRIEVADSAPARSSVAVGFTPPAPSVPAPAALASAAPPPTPPVTAVRSEDSILARIVSSITIPGEELGVVEPPRRPITVAAVDPATKQTLAAGEAKVAEEKADRAAATRTIAAAAKATPAARKSRETSAEEAEEARPAARTRGAKAELASKAPGRARAKADDEEAAAAKPKTAAEKRRADRKAAEEKASAKKERGDPERIWVQVAGGANDADLPRAWAAAQKKAAALKGRDAYTTPLRATNRVVTGPFKTEAEARAFVNQLSRQGVSAFQFTSAAGQKMTKLPAR